MFVLLLLFNFAVGTYAVIGGHDALNNNYPFQVSLRQRTYGTGKLDVHFCSGTILNDEWILTTASCLVGQNISEIVAIAGTNNVQNIGESYKIHFYVVHDNYTNFQYDNIALINVVGKIKFNENVTTIKLPTQDLSSYDIYAKFAGWGYSESSDQSASHILQEIDLKVIDNESCKMHHNITENHVCTFNKFAEGICCSDGGGPLIIGGIQIGISSYMHPCALGEPDVYTRVFSYVDWIDRKIENFAKAVFL